MALQEVKNHLSRIFLMELKISDPRVTDYRPETPSSTCASNEFVSVKSGNLNW